MSRLQAGFTQIWIIARAGERAIWILLILIFALGVWPGFMIWAIKHSVNQLASGDRNASLAYIGIIAGAGTVAILLNVIQPYFLRKVKDHVYHNLSTRLFDTVNRRTENQMLQATTRNRISSTSESVSSIYHGGLDGLSALLQVIVTGFSLTWILLEVAWWAPILILVGTALNVLLMKKAAVSESNFLQDISEISRLQGAFLGMLTTLNSAKEMRVFGIAGWIKGKWRTEEKRIARLTMKQTIKAACYKLLGQLGSGIVTSVVLLVGLWKLWQGTLNPGEVAALLIGGLHLEQLLSLVLSQGKHWLGRKIFLAELIQQPQDEQTEITTSTAKDTEMSNRNEEQTVSSNAISVRQLTFSYDGKENVINNINFDIPHGAKVAVVGANGSGKSTLMLILAGILKPDQGSVSSEEVGGFCLQDYGRYKLSVAENVYLGDITRKDREEDIAEVLQLTNAHFVDKLPQGRHTELWPEVGGSDLSEGQWQRLALARSMFRSIYRVGSVVIMDEPTSKLDPSNELSILESIINRLQGYTVLFVVHRLVGCVFADTVLMLDQGEIRDYGTHERLLETCEPYQAMWKASSSFIEAPREEEEGGVA
ncbi:ABC transporter ATP-binding protein [Paenibacillus xylanexedens]|uniref:ATP-binding cassette domain-containing protein n=1 Tax=Paenibacillus xylanexedens TaxID=528191 RepID=UPI0011A3DA87|nr:ABC transporter ATP-binding protein [Paenibacillus xylanexedens]